jgi:hypothetical protein
MMIAERIAPLGAMNSGGREAKRTEELIQVIETAPADEREAAREAP